jgi:hypothetical protein
MEVYDLTMPTRIEAPFATARKTAKVLGVSKSRFKALERLMRSKAILKAKDGDHGSSVVRSAKSGSTKSVPLNFRAKTAAAARKSKAK